MTDILETKKTDNFRNILKFDKGFCEFCQQFESGTGGHAYILDCNDKILYDDLLLSCAVKILGCTRQEETLVFARTHPDVEIFPTESKKRISADDVKKIINSAYTKPTMSNKKVFCVAVNVSSGEVWQNKLLKLLEEPPQNVFLLIAVPNAEELLPTLRSRCQVIKTGKFNDGVIAQFLNKTKNVATSKAEEIARLALGSVAKAQYIASNPSYMACVEDVLNIFGNMTGTKNMAQFLPIVAKYKDSYEDFFEIMENVLFDAILVKTNALQSLNLFKKTDIIKVADNYTTDALLRAIGFVEQAKKQLDNYASYNIVTDNLLLNILEVRYLCRQ